MHSAILLTLFLQYGRTINKKEIRNYLANQPSHVKVSSMHIAISDRYTQVHELAAELGICQQIIQSKSAGEVQGKNVHNWHDG